jgi:ATP-binding cassette subfamily F protein uup
VLYFDQLRGQIDSEATVMDNIAAGQEFVKMGNQNVHVMTYLQNFLFDPKRALIKAGMLSGGERNRLLLAKLFSQPGNVLVLDEPTNDLDVETLELLEGLLVEFDGVVLVVSHDREFLDNVATSTLAIDADGKVDEFVGGWSEWKRQDGERKKALEQRTPMVAPNPGPTAPTSTKTRRLTFKETKELEGLPARIEALEAEHNTLVESMGTAEFYKQDPAKIAAARSRHESLEREMKETFARWEELEGLA